MRESGGYLVKSLKCWTGRLSHFAGVLEFSCFCESLQVKENLYSAYVLAFEAAL